MPDSYRILLHPSAAEDKLRDRLSEIQNALPDFKVHNNPEICIAEFETGKNYGRKEIKDTVEKIFCDYNFIGCEITGFGYFVKGGSFSVNFPVIFSQGAFIQRRSEKDAPGGSQDNKNIQISFPEKLSECLLSEISGIKDLSVTESPCITLTEGLRRKEFLKIRKHTGFKISILDEILLRTFWKKGRGPKYKIRNFCFSFDVVRIAVEKNGKKDLEYDLTSKGWIKYPGPSGWGETLKNYRRIKGYESLPASSGKISSKWLIGDLHIGHYDMIPKTARPFDPKNPSEMDKILTENWNLAVKPGDEVFFLGDLTYNKSPESVEYLLSQLSGKIVFIRGNHDQSVQNAEDFLEYSYGGHKFLMIHNPGHAPEDYDGWIIHGHTHNSRMCEYPFINFKSRTINVSCEVISYRPVLFDDIVSIISHPERCPERIMSYESACMSKDVLKKE
ncbi:metallophosphoesterase [Methanoplanus limicola]|uniref:Metallophosphoesterase n=1 Tax=Methanoplanus limicola DSM 2279 TaxID=937775 RepID=H1YY91_9EURY|nr:metallophosphoesterase [Methanoplanus limicola]EHQ34186.1 metallophosphoesterase [Methanoplanus limicola DSM 2279]